VKVENIIFVHGAFQGGWVWDRIVPDLKKWGYNVFCPTLIGDDDDFNIGLQDGQRGDSGLSTTTFVPTRSAASLN